MLNYEIQHIKADIRKEPGLETKTIGNWAWASRLGVPCCKPAAAPADSQHFRGAEFCVSFCYCPTFWGLGCRVLIFCCCLDGFHEVQAGLILSIAQLKSTVSAPRNYPHHNNGLKQKLISRCKGIWRLVSVEATASMLVESCWHTYTAKARGLILGCQYPIVNKRFSHQPQLNPPMSPQQVCPLSWM